MYKNFIYLITILTVLYLVNKGGDDILKALETDIQTLTDTTAQLDDQILKANKQLEKHHKLQLNNKLQTTAIPAKIIKIIEITKTLTKTLTNTHTHITPK